MRLHDAHPDRAKAHDRDPRADRRKQSLGLVRAQDQGRSGGRLLERLEQGVLGVLVETMGALDDRDPVRPFDRETGHLAQQVAHRPRLGVFVVADSHLLPGPFRHQAMQVLVGAGVDQPAGTTRPARPGVRIVRMTQDPGREVEGERRLAHRGGSHEEERLRGAVAQHPLHGSDGRRLAARGEPSGSRRQQSRSWPRARRGVVRLAAARPRRRHQRCPRRSTGVG